MLAAAMNNGERDQEPSTAKARLSSRLFEYRSVDCSYFYTLAAAWFSTPHSFAHGTVSNS